MLTMPNVKVIATLEEADAMLNAARFTTFDHVVVDVEEASMAPAISLCFVNGKDRKYIAYTLLGDATAAVARLPKDIVWVLCDHLPVLNQLRCLGVQANRIRWDDVLLQRATLVAGREEKHRHGESWKTQQRRDLKCFRSICFGLFSNRDFSEFRMAYDYHCYGDYSLASVRRWHHKLKAVSLAYCLQSAQLSRRGQIDYYHGHLLPSQRVLNSIRERGIEVDLAEFAELSARLPIERDALMPKLKAEPFFLTELHDDEKVDAIRERYKNRPSVLTDFNTVLHLCRSITAALQGIIGHPVYIDSQTRIHPTNVRDLDTARAANRRSRAENPAPCIANLPGVYRPVLRAKPGSLLVELDLSAVEVRVAASRYHCQRLIDDCNAGDPYSMVVRELKPELSTATDSEIRTVHEALRNMCKTALLGLLYGQQAGSIARKHSLPGDQVDRIVASLRRRYEELFANIELELSIIKHRRYARTRLGHIRVLPDSNQEMDIRNRNSMASYNVQASAAESFFSSVVRIHDHLTCFYPESGIAFILHDSVLIEAPDDEAQEIGVAAGRILIRQYETDYPQVKFFVKSLISQRWGENK